MGWNIIMNIEKLIAIVKETDKIFFDDVLRGDISKKGDSDYVTRADIETSKYMEKRLKEEFPEVGFISEEEDMKVEEGKDYWILDPIDGTTNFMHTLSICGLSLALYSKGEIVAGVIYAPYTRELFWAEKNKGAYLNGKRIYCSDYKKMSDCVGMLEYNAYYKTDYKQAMEHAYKIYSAFQDIRTFGSSAVELAYIACGRADAFLGRYLKPWDYAAGLLIIEESGGTVSDLQGDIKLFELNRHIVATNGFIHEDFISLLKS